MLTDDENDGKEWCAMTMINKVQLSKALPEFGKLRCGTQVFVFINEQRLSVYDDFSHLHAQGRVHRQGAGTCGDRPFQISRRRSGVLSGTR